MMSLLILVYSATLHILQTYVLMKVQGRTLETPQLAYMRIAVATSPADVSHILRTYDLISHGQALYSLRIMGGAGRTGAALSDIYCCDLNFFSMKSCCESIFHVLLLRSQPGHVGLSLHNVPLKRYVTVVYTV